VGLAVLLALVYGIRCTEIAFRQRDLARMLRA
jgi:hypothetical protein